MKVKLAVFSFLILSFNGFCQKIDYQRIKDSLSFSCGQNDEETVRKLNASLLKIDTNFIGKNIEQYYYDLGMSYYMLSAFSENDSLLTLSNRAYFKALYHKPKMSSTLWNLAVNFFTIKDCSNMLLYLKSYKACTRKKFWSQKEIELLETSCL